MPSPFVALPDFPSVPNLPGVPPILPGFTGFIQPLLAIADAIFGGSLGFSQWGIFGQDGSPVLAVDSVFAIEYDRSTKISDYPQEQGGFQSYNKVQLPYQAIVEFLVGGTRFDFLNNVEQAVLSLRLVSVITPEIIYSSANLVRYAFRREAKSGVTLLKIRVWCEEVRITAGSQLTASSAAGTASTPGPANAQSPNATPAQQGGAVLPASPGTSGGTPGSTSAPPGNVTIESINIT